MRVRTEHWQMLLQFCENHPELITNRFNGVEGKAKGNVLWRSITEKLNSLGYGEKSVEGWRKALTDWKSKTKSKAASIRKELQQTGGGPNSLPPLSSLEEKLLDIMGNKSVYGDEEVPELGFGQVVIPNQKIVQCSTETESKTQSARDPGPSTSFCRTNEHDYVGGTCDLRMKNDELEEGAEVTPNKKRRKILQNSQTPNLKPSRRRPQQTPHLSNDLIKLNRESVDLLTSLNANLDRIANNTQSIAESIKIIANVMQVTQSQNGQLL